MGRQRCTSRAASTFRLTFPAVGYLCPAQMSTEMVSPALMMVAQWSMVARSGPCTASRPGVTIARTTRVRMRPMFRSIRSGCCTVPSPAKRIGGNVMHPTAVIVPTPVRLAVPVTVVASVNSWRTGGCREFADSSANRAYDPSRERPGGAASRHLLRGLEDPHRLALEGFIALGQLAEPIRLLVLAHRAETYPNMAGHGAAQSHGAGSNRAATCACRGVAR